MNSNSFLKNVIAYICRVCVGYLLIPIMLELTDIMLELTEIEYELKYGEK